MKIDSQKIFRFLEFLEEKNTYSAEAFTKLNSKDCVNYELGYLDAVKEILEEINLLIEEERNSQ